jgi:hypothetical protein
LFAKRARLSLGVSKLGRVLLDLLLLSQTPSVCLGCSFRGGSLSLRLEHGALLGRSFKRGGARLGLERRALLGRCKG